MTQFAPETQALILLLAAVKELESQVESLEDENKELNGRLNANSQNSSKPPSTDGFRKPSTSKGKDSTSNNKKDNGTKRDSDDSRPSPKSLRRKSGNKPVGQRGHQGSTLKQTEAPDHTRYYPVKVCEHCQQSLLSVKPCNVIERQVFEPGRFGCFEVTAHVAEVKDCRCGHTNPARFPKGVGSSVQYGPITQALTVYLYQYQLMPYKRISQFFLDIFGLEVSPGSICTFQANTHDQLESTESAIVKALKKVPVAGADETGMRVTGSLWWLHVVCSDEWTYYHLDPGKGHSAIETMGVLLVFAGVLVHDHYKAYFRYAVVRVLCNAHHLRELQGVVDRDCNHLAARLQRLLRLACHLRKGFQKAGMESMPEVIRHRIDAPFERTARRAQLEEADYMERRRIRLKEEKVRNTKAFNLFKRLVNYKEETLRFMNDFDIPFDNNGSEQDIRNGKVKQKISGCFRSKKGAKWYCRIRSEVGESLVLNIFL